MISRSNMRRQLRASGGIMNARQGYGLGSWVKEKFRKLVPNELADLAVKAAPFIAPFNPAIAGAMRGIGRFDQRGSISDALKQGVGTYAGGQAARYLGGADFQKGLGTPGDRFTSPLGTDTGFKLGTKATDPTGKVNSDVLNRTMPGDPEANIYENITSEGAGLKDAFQTKVRDATGLFKDVPILKELPALVQQQILVGGVTSAGTYLYNAFIADYPEPEEGEDMVKYLEERRQRVGTQMRNYFDNYFKFDKEYSAMTPEQKDAEVARYNKNQGGLMRQNYQTGGISMTNTAAQNRAINNARRAAANTELQAPRNRILQRMQQNQANQFDFGKHAEVSEAMAGNTGREVIPEYGMQTGYDFQKKSNMNPVASSILASGYQLGQEGIRALNPTSPDFLNFKKAYETANQQAGENIEGILTADTGTISAEQQANRNEYLESVGQQPDAPTPTPDAGPSPDVRETYSEYKARMLDSLRKNNFTGQKTTMTDLQSDGSYSGTSRELPQEDYYNYMLANPYAHGFNPITGLQFGVDDQGVMTNSSNFRKEMADFKKNNPDYNFVNLASGGRVGLAEGTNEDFQNYLKGRQKFEKEMSLEELYKDYLRMKKDQRIAKEKTMAADGGLMRLNYMIGGEAKQMEAGAPPIMYSGNMDPNAQAGLPSVPGPIQMAEDGPEFDMREEGGFQPLGRQEGKDDVPAMLAKNEFVMTADAVRAAGGGSIQKGAQKMYDTMKKLESRVS